MIPCSGISLKTFGIIVTHGKGRNFCPLAQHIATGNIKLPRTTAIFNMGPATHCPSLAKGLCKAFSPKGKHICYAMKAERLYPNNLPYRLAQMKFWKDVTAEDFASQFLLINALKYRQWTRLRLNEAGDFFSQKCLDKANRIAMILARFGIKTYCYTHRSDLDYSKVKHLIVSSSNFEDKNIPNAFRMVENVKRERPMGWSICKGDCRVCDLCSKRGSKVVIKKH